MKILHLVSQDSGGAGRAALRLHKALLNEKVESLMLVQSKTTDLPSVLRLAKTKPQKVMEKLRPIFATIPLFFYPKRHKDIFSPNALSNRALIKAINEIKPDVLHLHWINNGFLNIKDLTKLNIPMIWSLHDANPYTGGCHIVASACVRVGIHCKQCPLLNSKFNYDLSFWTFRAKAATYPKLNLTINGLSKWIASCARESALLKNKKIINLPNPIDTNAYKPIAKQIARELLGLNQTTKFITFGAINPTSTDRKGYQKLRAAISLLKNKNNIKLIVFGSSNGEMIEGVETIYMGYLSDDISLRILYSLSDVVVVPSLLESFGQVALESLSCGTPVVAFDTSGLKDIIDHKINGYLAKPYEEEELSRGIEWVLESPDYEMLSHNARKKALQKFDFKIVANQYINEYQNILNGGGWDKELLKSLLFTSKTKYITFGAISGTNVERKGYKELQEALNLLNSKSIKNYELLIFGSSSGEKVDNIKTHFLGYINDDETLRLAYSASDVFVVPSLAENLSNAIMESLSCGTPVVAFDIGGNSDMIDHKINGYLAKNTNDLANGIEWVLESPDYEMLSYNARKKVLDTFESKKIAKSYINEYQNILKQTKK